MALLLPRFSIRTRLALLVLGVAIPLVALLIWVAFHEFDHSREHVYDRTSIAAGGVVARLSAKLGDLESGLALLATRPSIQAMDPARCDPVLGEFVRLRPGLSTLELRDAAGAVVCAYGTGLDPPALGERFADFDGAIRSARFTVGNARLVQPSGEWVSVMTHPVRDAAGKVVGLFVLPIRLATLADGLFASIPESILIEIIDREGKVILGSHVSGTRVGEAAPEAILRRLQAGGEGQFADVRIPGEERLVAFASVVGPGWHVLAELDGTEAGAAFRRRLAAGLAVGIPFLLLVAAATWWMGKSIADPIRGLAATSARVARGDIEARARVSGPGEVAEVARHFNEMMGTLQRHREDRAALIDHYEHLVKYARDIVLLIDPSGRIVEANEAAVAAYGHAVDELRGMHIRELRAPVEQSLLDQQFRGANSPGGILFETVHRRKDGSTFPAEVSARSLEVGGRRYVQSHIRDITLRKQVEATILDSEKRFRTAIESAPDGVIIQTRGKFAYLNPEAARIFGARNPEELVGKPVIEHFHPDSRELVRERIRRLRDERATLDSVEETVLRSDGSRLAVEATAVPFTFEGEAGALAFLRDISERKRAGEALAQSELRFRTLVENVPNIAVQGFDAQRRVTFWNTASEALFGYSRDEALGQPLEDLIVRPEARASFVDAVTQWREADAPICAGECLLLHRDRTPVSAFASHVSYAGARGEMERYCLFVDLTALKRAEAKSEDWRNRYQTAILASGQLLHEWDPKSGDLTILGDTRRVLGFAPEELAGGLSRWRELIHADDLDSFNRELERATAARIPFRQCYRVRHKEGTWVTMQDDGYFVFGPSGEISCMVCFVVDVTAQNRARQHIEIQLDELRRWHAAMLGREERIAELKGEVNELLAAAGRSPVYRAVEHGTREPRP